MMRMRGVRSLAAGLLLFFLLTGCGGGGSGNGLKDFQFTLSPDGRQIAFVRPVSTTDPNASDLYVKKADGSGAHRVFDSAWSVSAPLWSPGSDKIVFTDVPNAQTAILTTIDLTTLQTRQLTVMNAIAESWGTDHKITFRSGGYRYQINDDGSGLVSLGPV